MIRRSIVARFAALAVVLTPALALAAGSAHDHASKNCASCDCMHGAPSAAGATAATSASAGGSTTSPQDLQKIWTGP
jgi:hypothetical protein